MLLFVFCFANSFSNSEENYNKTASSLITQEARELYEELRCLVCQNQSLLESDAPLALDLKKLIKEKLSEGNSKKEVKIFLVKRYGEFILLRPVLSFQNIVLWISPIIFLFIGGIVVFNFYYASDLKVIKKNNKLSNKEEKNLKRILKKGNY